MAIHTHISTTALSMEKAACFIDAPPNGANCIFIGRVRNHNLGKSVRAVTYDVFEPLAQKTLHDMCLEAVSMFDDQLRCFVEHFKGRLDVGGISVIMGVGSAHRDAAYQASRYLIEELKKRAPIWKQEHYIDGDSEWVKGHALCGHSHKD